MHTDTYNQRGIEPKNSESKFSIDELFFSVTDKEGKILSGNDVFIRVSKMDRDEVIGKPHNIIRHPDMPKTIFRIAWDTIKAKKPFVGYVKNMAKDGSYYWVLAAIYPVLNEKGEVEKYISIRVKPTSKFFKKAPEFYKQILEYEHRYGIDKTIRTILKRLRDLGFESYEHFAKKAFFEEIKSRENIIKDKNIKDCQVDVLSVIEENVDFIDILCNLQTMFFRINRYFNEVFSKVNLFLNLNMNLSKKSKFIFELAEDIRLLSLNASIESYKVKKEGVSFSTLSHEMRKNVELSEKKILQMSQLIENTKKDIEDIGFNILTAKLIIEMIVFFLKEMIEKLSNNKATDEEKEEILQNIYELFNLLSTYTKNLSKSIYNSKSKLRSIFYNIKELNVIINRLDFIHINGLIESSHAEGEGGGFSIIFSQMLKLIEDAKKEIINLETSIDLATKENLTVSLITDITQSKIEKIQKRYEEILRD
jgi:aerotaxis receptor